MKCSILIAAFAWASQDSLRDVGRLWRGLPFLMDYVRGMFPPDFRVLPDLLDPMGETIRMATTGVMLAAVVSLPLSFLVARETSPHIFLYILGRSVVSVLRGLPTLLWALLFVSLVGLGPLAGVFAITAHCIGTFGKLFSEAIEATLPKAMGIMEAMRLDGATEAQVLYHGLLPGVAPLFASYVLYYFEWAVRTGTILGLVGAGGIGLQLTASIRMFRRQETAAILILVLGVVVGIDLVSRAIRARLVGG